MKQTIESNTNTKMSDYEIKDINMHGRRFQQIWAALQKGEKLDKHTASDKYHCEQRTAQRILSYLHAEKHTRICGWIYAKNSHVRIPVYEIIDEDVGHTEDVPAPIAVRKDNTTYQAQRREDPAVRDGDNARKRNRRTLENEKKKFNDNGCSMWKSLLGVTGE